MSRLTLLILLQVAVLSLATFALLVFAQPNLSTTTNPATLLSIALTTPLAGLFVLVALLAFASIYHPQLAQPTWWLLLAATGISGGMAIAIPWEAAQVLASGHWGMSNLYEVSVLTLTITGTLALIFDRTHTPEGKLLPLIAPILAAAAAFMAWLASIGAATPQELVPALKNSILPLHVLANFIGYGCFALGAAAGAGILLRLRADKLKTKSHLPTVKTLEIIAYNAIRIGFPMFSLAILLGCIWAYQAWGGYWSWDPKETWALIVWLVYAAYLHTRLTRQPNPAVLAWWLLVGFAATLFCYIGVNMFLSGLHSYGSLGS